jgi:excisionase family DNA binding protein
MSRRAITTAQAAEMLGVSPQTVQKWVDAGHLSAWRTVGGHRRVDEGSVERMLAQRHGLESGASVDTSDGIRTVLIVEDNALHAQVMRAQTVGVLPQAQVTVLSSGIAALIHIGREMPDLLITDLHLPGLDGLAMLRQLRADGRTKNMPTLLMTALNEHELAALGPLPEGLPVLRKPVGDSALRSAMRDVLTLPVFAVA